MHYVPNVSLDPSAALSTQDYIQRLISIAEEWKAANGSWSLESKAISFLVTHLLLERVPNNPTWEGLSPEVQRLVKDWVLGTVCDPPEPDSENLALCSLAMKVTEEDFQENGQSTFECSQLMAALKNLFTAKSVEQQKKGLWLYDIRIASMLYTENADLECSVGLLEPFLSSSTCIENIDVDTELKCDAISIITSIVSKFASNEVKVENEELLRELTILLESIDPIRQQRLIINIATLLEYVMQVFGRTFDTYCNSLCSQLRKVINGQIVPRSVVLACCKTLGRVFDFGRHNDILYDSNGINMRNMLLVLISRGLEERGIEARVFEINVNDEDCYLAAGFNLVDAILRQPLAFQDALTMIETLYNSPGELNNTYLSSAVYLFLGQSMKSLLPKIENDEAHFEAYIKKVMSFVSEKEALARECGLFAAIEAVRVLPRPDLKLSEYMRMLVEQLPKSLMELVVGLEQNPNQTFPEKSWHLVAALTALARTNVLDTILPDFITYFGNQILNSSSKSTLLIALDVLIGLATEGKERLLGPHYGQIVEYLKRFETWTITEDLDYQICIFIFDLLNGMTRGMETRTLSYARNFCQWAIRVTASVNDPLVRASIYRWFGGNSHRLAVAIGKPTYQQFLELMLQCLPSYHAAESQDLIEQSNKIQEVPNSFEFQDEDVNGLDGSFSQISINQMNGEPALLQNQEEMVGQGLLISEQIEAVKSVLECAYAAADWVEPYIPSIMDGLTEALRSGASELTRVAIDAITQFINISVCLPLENGIPEIFMRILNALEKVWEHGRYTDSYRSLFRCFEAAFSLYGASIMAYFPNRVEDLKRLLQELFTDLSQSYANPIKVFLLPDDFKTQENIKREEEYVKLIDDAVGCFQSLGGFDPAFHPFFFEIVRLFANRLEVYCAEQEDLLELEKQTISALIGESVKYLKENIVDNAHHFNTFLQRCLWDKSYPKVRNNAAFALGEMAKHCTGVAPFLESVLTSLTQRTEVEENARVKDNLVGAIAKVAISYYEFTTVDYIKVIVETMPLEADYMENEAVFDCLLMTHKNRKHLLENYYPKLLNCSDRLIANRHKLAHEGKCELSNKIISQAITISIIARKELNT